MARLKDVAERAGVSLSVASRVLNNVEGARINADTRIRVLDAAAALEYVADHRARALRLSRAGAIALVVPEVNNAIFASLHAGVQEACQARGSAVFLAQLSTPGNAPHHLSALIGNGRVDGVILQRSEQYSDDALRALISADSPTVLFNSALDGHTGSVSLDDHASVRVALTHLAELGHRRVGFLSGAAQHDAATRRQAAFFDQVEALGLTARPEWVQPAGWEAPAGAEAMHRLLDSPELPTAVLGASMNATIGALSAAVTRGVDVPTQLSLIGIHDAWLAHFVTPSLTTVELPMHSAGHAAATMLLDHLEGSPLRNAVISYPAPIVHPRASTAAPSLR